MARQVRPSRVSRAAPSGGGTASPTTSPPQTTTSSPVHARLSPTRPVSGASGSTLATASSSPRPAGSGDGVGGPASA
jgi:hypothetical protein